MCQYDPKEFRKIKPTIKVFKTSVFCNETFCLISLFSDCGTSPQKIITGGSSALSLAWGQECILLFNAPPKKIVKVMLSWMKRNKQNGIVIMRDGFNESAVVLHNSTADEPPDIFSFWVKSSSRFLWVKVKALFGDISVTIVHYFYSNIEGKLKYP